MTLTSVREYFLIFFYIHVAGSNHITWLPAIGEKLSLAGAKTKERAEKYDTRLAINGGFVEIIEASVIPISTGKKMLPKKYKPKKI